LREPVVKRLLLLFVLSGLGAVAVETIWMRWLRLLLGATAPAASATLVAFFAGHALGAAWAARRAARWRRPLVVYGRLELAAAAAAAAVPLLLAAGAAALAPVYDSLRELPAALTATRFALALVATLPAAFCFGATFPAISAAAAPVLARLGARGAALYAGNTLGAAAGTAAAAFWLPGAIGVRATYGLAIAVLVAAGAGALRIARRGEKADGAAPSAEPAAATAPRSAPPRRSQRRSRVSPPTPAIAAPALLALAVLSGLCPFAAQVLLIQSFAQVLNQSSLAFGAVLVVVRLSISAASTAVALFVRRASRAGRAGGDERSVLGVALVVAALATAAFPALLAHTTGGLGYVGAADAGLPYLAAALGTVAGTAGPLLLAGSTVFPLVLALAARAAPDGTAPGAVVGRLASANTAGAIAGALAAPWLLLPAFGPWLAFVAVAAVWGLAALLLPDTAPRRRAGRAAGLAAGAMAIVLWAPPGKVPVTATAPGERLLAVDSSAAGVVAVVARDGERLIRVDGHYALGGSAERVHHERQAHLPLLLAPGARRVLHAGSATGISAGAALAHPIESLSLVELLPAVARAGAQWFSDSNRNVYDDPRTTVVLDDARNFLATTSEHFDVVIADLFVPWHAGAGALYAREHFEAVRARLLPEGLFCQWLPLYQLSERELRVLAATFLDVFPQTAVFRGDFFGRFPIVALIGFTGAPPDPELVSARAAALGRSGESDRWIADPLGPWALYVGPLAPLGPALASEPRNRDDAPVLETLAAAGHAGGGRGKLDPVVGLTWIEFAEALQTAARASGDPLWPALPAPAVRAQDGGALLQRAGALYVAGQYDAAARAFAAAAQRLPARLVSQAPADATAAELWHTE
jgi:spermidine synthase